MGKELALKFIEKHKRDYPSLVSSFSEELKALLSHLKLPARLRKALRTTSCFYRKKWTWSLKAEEVVKLKPDDIDSQRGLIHIKASKRRKDDTPFFQITL